MLLRDDACSRRTVASHSAAARELCDDPSTVRPRLLIVDDHAHFRESARTLLELEGFEVVGLAADGEDALAQARRLSPEVVLLDVQLPGMDGFEVARTLARGMSPPHVVLVSSRDRSVYTSQLRDAPVSGFLGKSELSGAALHALVA